MTETRNYGAFNNSRKHYFVKGKYRPAFAKSSEHVVCPCCDADVDEGKSFGNSEVDSELHHESVIHLQNLLVMLL